MTGSKLPNSIMIDNRPAKVTKVIESLKRFGLQMVEIVKIPKKHEGDERQFVWESKAWYGKSSLRDHANTDSITLGFYAPGGGSSGEFTIEWRPLGCRIVPYIHAFDDSWSALSHFKDVIDMLACLDDTNPTPADIVELLIEIGITDNTPRVRN